LLFPGQICFRIPLPVFNPLDCSCREEDEPPRDPTPEPAATDASKTVTAPVGTLSLAELDRMETPPRPKKKSKTDDAGQDIVIPERPSGPPLDDVSLFCILPDKLYALFLMSPFLPVFSRW